jgi:HPt (histidine-containing phosphotransfer) domain-containing protein
MNPLSKTVTDPQISLQRLGGDEKLLATLAQFFLEDAPPLMGQLNEANQSGDMKAVALRAHSLRGLSSTFEAIPFQEIAAEVELSAKTGDMTHLNQTLPQLKVEFDRLIEALQPLVH